MGQFCLKRVWEIRNSFIGIKYLRMMNHVNFEKFPRNVLGLYLLKNQRRLVFIRAGKQRKWQGQIGTRQEPGLNPDAVIQYFRAVGMALGKLVCLSQCFHED